MHFLDSGQNLDLNLTLPHNSLVEMDSNANILFDEQQEEIHFRSLSQKVSVSIFLDPPLVPTTAWGSQTDSLSAEGSLVREVVVTCQPAQMTSILICLLTCHFSRLGLRHIVSKISSNIFFTNFFFFKSKDRKLIGSKLRLSQSYGYQ